MRPPDEPLVIGVDCSTTGSKATVVDVGGRTVAAGSAPLTTTSPRPGWHEQDAATWWPATDAAVRQALADLDRAGGNRHRIAAVCVAHQRETFVAVDADNRPLHLALLWLDGRAAAEIEEFGTPEVERLCGKPADITPALYKLAWVRRHRPEWLRRAHRVVDTHAFLVRELTGEWATSLSSADPLALIDISTRDYSPELLRIAGVERAQLPALHTAGAVIGPVARPVAAGWGLGAGVAVVAGLGDGQAAGVGAQVLDPSTAYLNAGTALLLGTECRGYLPARAYRSLLSVIDGNTTLETFLSSGNYLPTWFRRQFGPAEAAGAPDAELEAAAREVPAGSEGLLTVPYWNAAQTPHWDPHASGVMFGWRGAHTKAHAYRSVLEGIAQEVRLQLDGLEGATGNRVRSIRAMGGGIRSRLFSQILADVLERPLELCAEPEISALGAAVVAMAGIGAYPDLGTASKAMTRIGQRIEPDPAVADLYGRLRGVHGRLYPQLRDVMRDLDRVVTDEADAADPRR
jgi:xylulokinase